MIEDDPFAALRDVTGYLGQVEAGIRNLKALPLWAQAAHSMLTYNPESVLYQVRQWQTRLTDCTDETGRICVVVMAAHRIHRFGAGPAVAESPWNMVLAKVAELAYPEDLAEGLELNPLEPQYFSHAGHQRGTWPILILPPAFYAGLGLQPQPEQSDEN